MADPLVSVGLVTWNSAPYLPACLSALARQEDVSLELIVVDNGSSDNSVGLAAEFPGPLRIIRNTENTGFCHAHNQAIEAARGAYYLALNPDVEMRPGFIRRLVAVLEQDPRCGTSVGKLLLPAAPGEPVQLDSTGLFINCARRQWIRGHREQDAGQYDTACEVFGADGAAPLYRRQMLEDTRIQGQYFDESFFAHKEDVDLAWRARLFGWTCRYEPAAVAVHHRTFRPGRREAISSEIRLHAVTNRYLLMIKNEMPVTWRRDWPRIVWYDLKILVYVLLFERHSLAAFPMVWRLRPRLQAWRTEILSRMRATPGDIVEWFCQAAGQQE